MGVCVWVGGYVGVWVRGCVGDVCVGVGEMWVLISRPVPMLRRILILDSDLQRIPIL